MNLRAIFILIVGASWFAAYYMGVGTKEIRKTIENLQYKEEFKPGHTIMYCMSDLPFKFQPGNLISTSNRVHMEQVFDTLYRYNLKKSSYEPALATSTDVSYDRTVYTFHLRRNVYFHSNEFFRPTRHLEAQDVKFTLDRFMKVNNPFYNDSYKSLRDKLMQHILSIQVLDKHTVQIILKHRYDLLIPMLSNVITFGIVPKEYFETMLKKGLDSKLADYPIGTGPWVYHKKKYGYTIEYIANSRYWDHPPYESRLKLKVIDTKDYYLNMLTNACDVTTQLEAGTVIKMQQLKNVQLHRWNQSLTTTMLLINQRSPDLITSNIIIRRAMMYSINKQRLIKDIYYDQALSANTLVPKALLGNNINITNYQQDIAKAKDLANQVGIQQRNELLKLIVYKGSPNYIKLAEYLEEDFANIGIKLDIYYLDLEEFTKVFYSKDFDLSLFTWDAQKPYPIDFYVNVLDYSKNSQILNWHNNQYIDLLNQLKDYKHTPDVYNQISTLINQELPILPLVHQQYYVATSSHVKNYNTGIGNIAPLYRIKVEY